VGVQQPARRLGSTHAKADRRAGLLKRVVRAGYFSTTSGPAHGRLAYTTQSVAYNGVLIDPNQHVAVVKGHIDNKDHKLRPGQFLTASITLPLATDETRLPSAAVLEDGGQSYVFVQPDAKKPIYEQRRIFVARRGQDAVHIRAKLTAEQERQGFQTVQPGERVITVGALELKAMLDDLKAH
jgi:multidrug efflux pump subunit AcrA (membrane-fusion protein)